MAANAKERNHDTGNKLAIIIQQDKGWKRLSEMARSWQLSRLKGIQVNRTYGTPFLAATQVFDVRPTDP